MDDSYNIINGSWKIKDEAIEGGTWKIKESVEGGTWQIKESVEGVEPSFVDDEVIEGGDNILKLRLALSNEIIAPDILMYRCDIVNSISSLLKTRMSYSEQKNRSAYERRLLLQENDR
eukprot:GHVR01028409.1.p1 GENE.GHVR01028409.1~~GHVR01028409.1.p1  ORF type:complete len:118 (+),score=30.53 GHVR01028409.1:55-408(+)